MITYEYELDQLPRNRRAVLNKVALVVDHLRRATSTVVSRSRQLCLVQRRAVRFSPVTEVIQAGRPRQDQHVLVEPAPASFLHERLSEFLTVASFV